MCSTAYTTLARCRRRTYNAFVRAGCRRRRRGCSRSGRAVGSWPSRWGRRAMTCWRSTRRAVPGSGRFRSIWSTSLPHPSTPRWPSCRSTTSSRWRSPAGGSAIWSRRAGCWSSTSSTWSGSTRPPRRGGSRRGGRRAERPHDAPGWSPSSREHLHPLVGCSVLLAPWVDVGEPVRGAYMYRWDLDPELRTDEERLIAAGRLPAVGARFVATRLRAGGRGGAAASSEWLRGALAARRAGDLAPGSREAAEPARLQCRS